MADPVNLAEPTRPLPPPRMDRDGNWYDTAWLSARACKTRARLAVPPSKIIPVIVIPGIMGSNLCATANPAKPRNGALSPGDQAWRPPNGTAAGLAEAKKWKTRSPAQRQQILDPTTLDVDGRGEINLTIPPCSFMLDSAQASEQGWGEVHWDSYGGLLTQLQLGLNTSLTMFNGVLTPGIQWSQANAIERRIWGASDAGIMAPMTMSDLKALTQYYFPVYAFGYNWLNSNEVSAQWLEKRIDAIMTFWSTEKRACKPVILVTHSMGGLVARACAKKIPGKIAGIVHGVMPALGAPICYRRIACGTESSSPSRNAIGDAKMEKFAEIAGTTTETTTPVLATAVGPLELLPNHLYPGPWLFASFKGENGTKRELVPLPCDNPYDLYRDTTSWYRMIDPTLADPVGKYSILPGGVKKEINKAINQAETFHKDVLQTYYHPKTFAFYGADKEQLSFGQCHWEVGETKNGMAKETLLQGRLVSHDATGSRMIDSAGGRTLHFSHSVQEVLGDGIVPEQSGAGPQGKIRQLFRTRGYDHQGSYNDPPMRLLTLHLVARIAQEIK